MRARHKEMENAVPVQTRTSGYSDLKQCRPTGRRISGRNVITDERIRKYLSITEEAMKYLVVVTPKNTHSEKIADDFLTMARSYYSDAKHFYEKGELVDAFACINYAHGWLDAGARLGLWDTRGSELFTI